jgi:hypothetical protein
MANTARFVQGKHGIEDVFGRAAVTQKSLYALTVQGNG